MVYAIHPVVPARTFVLLLLLLLFYPAGLRALVRNFFEEVLLVHPNVG